MKPGAFSGGSEPPRLLSEKMKTIRALHPTPAEVVLHPDQDVMDGLFTKMTESPDDKQVQQMAKELSSREVAALFPLMVRTGTGDRLAGRITLAVRERACPSLVQSGWAALQLAWPHPAAARALAMLCRILEKDAKKALKIRPAFAARRESFSADALTTRRETLSAGSLTARRETLSADALTARRETLSAESLISRFLSPDHRQFPRAFTAKVIKRGLPLEKVGQEYKIAFDSALGLEVGLHYFLTGPSAVFTKDASVLNQILPRLPQAGQADIISRFLRFPDIGPENHNSVCQMIYSHFGSPAAEPAESHPVWRLVKPRERALFGEWVKAATIGSHCREHPHKARLYLEFTASITHLEHWDDETLLIHFPGFIIADTRRNPGLAIYYQLSKAGALPFSQSGGYFQLNPANPAVPHRQIDDAVRMRNFRGIIGLPFDEEGIRLSRIFLDLCLKDAASG